MDISRITDYLYVGAQPKAEDAQELAAMDVGLIISMIGFVQPPAVFAKPPFRLVWLPSHDTFFTPISTNKLMRGVVAALTEIRGNGRVLVYCRQGRHRSVIMASAILISHGCSAEAAMSLIQARREVADPRAWYVQKQIIRFEKDWQK